jgi:lipoic acid synthetase
MFAEYRRIGEEMGFLFVASAPFVRSSYNAEAFSRKVMAERLAQIEAAQGSVEVR